MKKAYYVSFLLGAAMLAAAAYWAVSAFVFIQHASSAPGTVIRLDHADLGFRKGAYYPVVTFHTRSGSEHTFRNLIGTIPSSYQVGDAVEVLYLESDPSDAVIHGRASLWGRAIIIGSLGTLLLLVGGLRLFLPQLRRKRDGNL